METSLWAKLQIQKILNRLGVCNESKIHDTPENVILTKKEDGNRRKQKWHYRSVIGHMAYLAGTTILDILFDVHHCAKYRIDTKHSYEEAAKSIGCYLN